MGPAIGSVVGGAVGASGGLMGAAVVSALVPGIGPIMAVGLTALSLVGLIGGVVAGAAAGGALENAMADGLPKDELYVYEDALRQGRTVLIVMAQDDSQAEALREALHQAGAESLDAARDAWWVGLRTAEAEAYQVEGGDFTQDEVVYRRGFEAALRTPISGKLYSEAAGYLQTHYPDVYDREAFRRGYERGLAYYERLTYDRLTAQR
jgi:hypothetical protein